MHPRSRHSSRILSESSGSSGSSPLANTRFRCFFQGRSFAASPTPRPGNTGEGRHEGRGHASPGVVHPSTAACGVEVLLAPLGRGMFGLATIGNRCRAAVASFMTNHMGCLRHPDVLVVEQRVASFIRRTIWVACVRTRGVFMVLDGTSVRSCARDGSRNAPVGLRPPAASREPRRVRGTWATSRIRAVRVSPDTRSLVGARGDEQVRGHQLGPPASGFPADSSRW